MAHTKAGGSTKNNRESAAKYLGVKIQDGQKVIAGNIIVRQRGTRYCAGLGVRTGSDDTLYAVQEGTVKFAKKNMRGFDGARKSKVVVQITK